ncbi:hypothetical protein ACSQ67_005176 [Phaseolus vulgaris]
MISFIHRNHMQLQMLGDGSSFLDHAIANGILVLFLGNENIENVYGYSFSKNWKFHKTVFQRFKVNIELYYGGNEYIDELETLCQERAVAAFGVDGNKWGVNVQPLSGSPANFAVYTAKSLLLLPLFIYGFLLNRKLITPFIHEKIADEIGVFLMMDMAHISGLVAASVLANPFEYCDIVTTTTHKVCLEIFMSHLFFKRSKRWYDILQERLCMDPVLLWRRYLIHYGNKGIDGARVEKILDMASITLNKNSVPGDKSALVPGGHSHWGSCNDHKRTW